MQVVGNIEIYTALVSQA